MRFSLIAAPLELGCGTTGCAMGGAALVSGENGLLSFLTHNGISASADSAFVPMTARREEEPAPHYLPEVVTACCATRDAVSAAQGEGAFPVTLGGDHALGLGTVAGTAQHYSPEELSLVWVDAHTDINTENSSLSGNIHGMPIAALLGLCGQELSSVCGGLPALRPENVHIIFARDIDPAEERIIAEQGVHLYRMSEIKEQGLSAVLHRLLGNITTPFCHVSWDVDSLDASFIPATGLPIPDGPDPKAVTDVLLALALTLLLSVPVSAAWSGLPRTGAAYAGQLSDVTKDSPFYENIAALWEYGLTVGKADGSFGVKDNLTVGQTVIFAGRLRSLSQTGPAPTGPSL